MTEREFAEDLELLLRRGLIEARPLDPDLPFEVDGTVRVELTIAGRVEIRRLADEGRG